VRVRLSADGLRLRQDVTVVNPSATTPFDFTAALHTYLVVAPPPAGGIAALSVEGLSGTSYSDSLDGGAEKPQDGPVAFDREVDRIYLGAPDAGIVARNAVAAGGSVEVRKAGFRDAVVWNPWADKARAMADFGDDEYRGMLCIEPAVAKSGAVTLGPGSEWRGWQELVYSPPK
jgi:glucose-6-phosphate 1-epimerase